MRDVLIFGGSVFIGKAIAKKFIENGDKVYTLNRGNHNCIDGAIQLIANRNYKDEVSKVLEGKKFEIVIDGSAYTPNQTQIALEVLGVTMKHYIHISSAAVYSGGKQPYTEKSERGTSIYWGDYSTNKFLCEEKLFSEWSKNGLPITIIRPFYVYGPGNNLDRETYIFSRITRNQPIIVPGMGKCKLQFSYIDDLCDAIVNISNTDRSIGEAYNIPGEITTFEDWIKLCGEIVGIEPKMIYVDTKEIGYKSREWFPFRDIDMIGNCNKIEQHLNILPAYTLKKGLEKTFQYYGMEKLRGLSKLNEVEKKLLKYD